MRSHWSYITVCVLACGLFIAGCASEQKQEIPAETVAPEATISSVARFVSYQSMPVRGIGLVAGLPGTGSSECPQKIQKHLEKYILQQLSSDGSINAAAFIASQNTAVVEVLGIIPTMAGPRESFDIVVKPLAGTQTTSLDGGYLYTTELKEISRLARVEQFAEFSKSQATAEGAIYSNKLSPSKDKTWYVLGGGSNLQASSAMLILQNPNLITANLIRNRINERFGPKTAIPISSAQIRVKIPADYRDQKSRYLQMLSTLQLGEKPELRTQRIQELARQLATGPDKDSTEIALEAIGKPVAKELATLLEHPDPAVQFHAARCLSRIGDGRAIPILRKIALTPNNPNRLDAIRAIGHNSKRSDSGPILTNVLSDPNVEVRLTAYEILLRNNSSIISRKIVAGDFAVDSIICSGKRVIYAYQEATPRIVIFGSPMNCNNNIFLISDDGAVTINAKPGDEYISISRKHPSRPRVIGPISSGYEISNLLQALGERSETSTTSRRKGLAVPYADILPILKKMCKNNAIDATFIAGPAPKMDILLETLPSIDR
ncbi:MAG: flagellar basal body P-ring protein FlgI [Planctomycetota bacterium]|jgi:hypothetical protein